MDHSELRSVIKKDLLQNALHPYGSGEPEYSVDREEISPLIAYSEDTGVSILIGIPLKRDVLEYQRGEFISAKYSFNDGMVERRVVRSGTCSSIEERTFEEGVEYKGFFEMVEEVRAEVESEVSGFLFPKSDFMEDPFSEYD